MDRLSSCYFCGGVLDVSLSEYPIIPKSLDPEAEKQGTVVLCSTCREKLATIIEPAVGAAKADARERAEPVADTGATEPLGGLGDSETPIDDDTAATENVVEPADDGSLLGNDSVSAAEQEPSEQSATVESTPEPGTTETAAAGVSNKRSAESTGQKDTETGSEDAEESESSADGDDSPSLTKLEYNKVMRLLKNREMPVDRAEIREVAINAYDIDGERFDAVIEAAVDRDLLGQQNGQLVRTD